MEIGNVGEAETKDETDDDGNCKSEEPEGEYMYQWLTTANQKHLV